MSATTGCQYCGQQLVWFGCAYPFFHHPAETPRHGEWVPDHNCDADWSRRSGVDVPVGSTCHR